MMGTWLPETCWATIKRNKKYKKWHLVGFSYPHCMHILERRTHFGIYLNGMNSDSFLHLPERLITATVVTWIRASSNSPYDRVKLILLPPLCILGNNQLHNHFRRRLLTGYSQTNDSWNDDLPPPYEVFLDGPLCEFYHRQQRLEMWPQHWPVILKHMDGFDPPVTEG